MAQVPLSVAALKGSVDFWQELSNGKTLELVNSDWESFERHWYQQVECK
jgi:hypothetical protein